MGIRIEKECLVLGKIGCIFGDEQKTSGGGVVPEVGECHHRNTHEKTKSVSRYWCAAYALCILQSMSCSFLFLVLCPVYISCPDARFLFAGKCLGPLVDPNDWHIKRKCKDKQMTLDDPKHSDLFGKKEFLTYEALTTSRKRFPSKAGINNSLCPGDQDSE